MQKNNVERRVPIRTVVISIMLVLHYYAHVEDLSLRAERAMPECTLQLSKIAKQYCHGK